MELLKGQPLKEHVASGPMSIDRVLELSVQLADALDAAHGEGIVHRDIKPANLFVNERGDLKVLDFGLAKMGLGEVESDSAMPTERAEDPLTSPGTTVGTVNYMSPEQVRGEALDARTDLYSAGVVLYQMATGALPFTGNTSGMVFTSIMTAEATPARQLNPAIPEELERVINRLLEKDRDLRYQTSRDLMAELKLVQRGSGSLHSAELPAAPAAAGPMGSQTAVASDPDPLPTEAPASGSSASAMSQTIVVKETPQWIRHAMVAIALVALGAAWLALRGGSEPDAAPPLTAPGIAATAQEEERTVIVVLPFENLGAAEDEYFAQGVTDEISGRLGALEDLSVISRNSAQRYAGTEKTVQQIGEELGVTHILEGRVRWAKGDEGSRVRITPALIRVADDTQVWASTLDREINDIFALQGEIAEQVAASLGVELADSQIAALSRRMTDSAEAYQAYLRAQELSNMGYSQEYTLAAIRMFERAVEIDPEFSQAWAVMARRMGEAYYNGYINPAERATYLAMIKSATDRSLELAPDDTMTRLAQGYYYYYGLGDFESALEAFEHAIAASPGDADALEASAWVLRRMGRWDEFFATIETVVELNPGAPALLAEIADTRVAARQFDQAADLYRRATDLVPDMATAWKGWIGLELYGRGSTAGARALLERWPSVAPGRNREVARLERDWSAYLEAAQASEPEGLAQEIARNVHIGEAHRRLGNREQATSAFEAARALLPENPEDDPAELLPFLAGYISSGLGEMEATVVAADNLRAANPDDKMQGEVFRQRQAILYARSGRAEQAIEILAESLESNYFALGIGGYPATREWLRLDPEWDPLREDPRFQALLDD
jgi:TolB-like protein